MSLRVRITNIVSNGPITVVQFAPVMAQMSEHRHGMPKDKDGADTHPHGHGGHKHHRDARWTVPFATAQLGVIEGEVPDYVETVEEVGPDEVLRKREVQRYKKGPIPTLFPRPEMAAKVEALQLGAEYDVPGIPTADSTFTPVVHA